jgi:hypothetical protein
MTIEEYHGYSIKQNDGENRCYVFTERGRLISEESSVPIAKKFIDGEIEGRHPSDWQLGGVKAAHCH